MLTLLLGNSWHPGDTILTEHLGLKAGIAAGARVLDVACGTGESARALASRFGCSVVGVDLLSGLVQAARATAAAEGLSGAVSFEVADGVTLPFAADAFDLVLCECSLCTFPDKPRAVREFARVLKPGGAVVVADVTLEPGHLPPELSSTVGALACLAEAVPLTDYAALLVAGGLQIESRGDCRQEAREFLQMLDRKLTLALLAQAIGNLPVEGLDLRAVRGMVASLRNLVERGHLSYGYVIGRKA